MPYDLSLSALQANPALAVLVGAVLLVAGRRLFWFAVGTAGFLFAYQLAAPMVHSGGVRLVLAVLVGLLGALLAIFLQKVAVVVAGFLAGARFVLSLIGPAPATPGLGFWLALLAGGVVAAILALLLFQLALVVVSALLGASLVVAATGLAPPAATFLALGLAAAGVLVQSTLFRRRPARA